MKINPAVLTSLTVLLVGALGFGLGRLSRIQENYEPVRIEFPSGEDSGDSGLTSDLVANPIVSPEQVVASKNGDKYHLPWCSGAQRIKEENKIWFESPVEAKRAGYTPAANCPGIK